MVILRHVILPKALKFTFSCHDNFMLVIFMLVECVLIGKWEMTCNLISESMKNVYVISTTEENELDVFYLYVNIDVLTFQNFVRHKGRIIYQIPNSISMYSNFNQEFAKLRFTTFYALYDLDHIIDHPFCYLCNYLLCN